MTPAGGESGGHRAEPAPGGQSRSVTQESLCVTSRSYQPKLPAGSGQYCRAWPQSVFDLRSSTGHICRERKHIASRLSLSPARRSTRGRAHWHSARRYAGIAGSPRATQSSCAFAQMGVQEGARGPHRKGAGPRPAEPPPCRRAAGRRSPPPPAPPPSRLLPDGRASPGRARQRRHRSGQINRDHELVTLRASQPAGSVVQRCDGPRKSVHGNRVPTRDQPREACRGR